MPEALAPEALLREEAEARRRDLAGRELDLPARDRLRLERLDEVRRDDERAAVEDRRERDFDPEPRDFADFVSPFSARILLTVRAATSACRPLYRPDFLALSLMCSYCRSRFGLAPLGISLPPTFSFYGIVTYLQYDSATTTCRLSDLAALVVKALSKGAPASVPFTVGMLAGSAGMLAYCLVCLVTLDRLHALAGSLTAWAAWFVVAGGIYFAVVR